MNDRHKAWKEKQAKIGKKAISTFVNSEVKDLIDRECKRTEKKVAEVIEKAVINTYTDTQVRIPEQIATPGNGK
jgi:ATP-dependent Lon protease